MTAIASPEFISLCQSQLRLLTQRLAESSAALYIADISESGSEPSNFVPVVSYPEPVESWVTNFERATPWSQSGGSRQLALPGSVETLNNADNADLFVMPPIAAEMPIAATAPPPLQVSSAIPPAVSQSAASQPAASRPAAPQPSSGSECSASYTTERSPNEQPFDQASQQPFRWPDILRPEQQLVMPLVYTDVVVGLLVAVRPDRAWASEERRYIEAVAQSLAGGCVLERRNQWLQAQLAHKSGLQSRQSEIFHNLLHQFRNPLTAVSTFGQLLVKRLEGEDPNQPIATGIVRENKRLRELVTHFDEAVALGDADLPAEGAPVLQLPGVPQLPPAQSLLPAEPSTIVLGHPLTLTAQYLPDVVEPALAVAGIVAAEKGVVLQAQVASDTPLVWGEEEALGEVVSNLIDNAIKYSPAGAQVWVQTGVSRVGSVGHYQGIVVGDTGPGIPAGDLARLFERNYRGVQAESTIPGTGLGLAIAQSLVDEMQGSIEVISPAAGTPWLPPLAGESGAGTVFIVWLLEVERV